MNEPENTPDESALIKSLVLAAHHDLETVRQTLAERPDLLNAPHKWGDLDYETPIGAAAHVGNRPIAEYLLSLGAPQDICVAAMLGRVEGIGVLLDEDPSRISSTGAHGISLIFHAALGGSTEIAAIVAPAAPEAALNAALHAAIMTGHADMVAWLLANGVTDTTVKDYQGRTPLEAAHAGGNERIIELLAAAD